MKRALQRAKLPVGVSGAGQLDLEDLRVLSPQPPLLEQEAAEVAELKLPELA
jgi:hypothetical protein